MRLDHSVIQQEKTFLVASSLPRINEDVRSGKDSKFPIHLNSLCLPKNNSMIQLIKCEQTANDNIVYINPASISALFNSTQKPEFPSVCIVLEGEKKFYVKGDISDFLALATIIDPISAPVKKAAAPKATAAKAATKPAATKAPAAKAKPAAKKAK